jgi:hypothetical protein
MVSVDEEEERLDEPKEKEAVGVNVVQEFKVSKDLCK